MTRRLREGAAPTDAQLYPEALLIKHDGVDRFLILTTYLATTMNPCGHVPMPLGAALPERQAAPM